MPEPRSPPDAPTPAPADDMPPPPDANEVGRSAWTFLHALAAAYPNRPSAEKQESARRFFELLGDVYPCRTCAEGFREAVAQHPPRTESKSALATWVCQRHNDVNALQGKPLFDCTRALERWGWGDDDEAGDAEDCAAVLCDFRGFTKKLAEAGAASGADASGADASGADASGADASGAASGAASGTATE